MKAAVFHSQDDIGLEEVPRPSIGKGELLVRVAGVGLCGSDIDKVLQKSVPPGTVLGHEIVGVVAEIGPGVEDFEPGQRVAVAHRVSCQSCHYCERGSDSKCALFLSTNVDPGGFAEYVRVPAPNVQLGTFLIPDQVSFEQAVFVEPLGCCARAIDRSHLRPGDTIVIVGMGSIGLLLAQLAKLLQVKVVASEVMSSRLQLARSFGIDVAADPTARPVEEVVRELTNGRGADMVLSTVASQSVLDRAISTVRDGGLVHFFAGRRGGLELRVDLNELYEREVGLMTTYSSSPRFLCDAFHLIVEGQIRTAELISHRLPMADLLLGVRMMTENRALKVYIEVQPGLHE
jgi:L-iditol 2-dehydrogenase